MYKLWATLIKDVRILMRDAVGIILMFGMPIILVLIVTSIQNSTFELAYKNQVSLLVCDRDTGEVSAEFIRAIDKIGLFKMLPVSKAEPLKKFVHQMHSGNELLGIIIPSDFSSKIDTNSKIAADKALNSFGLKGKWAHMSEREVGPVILYYQPILEVSYRQSINSALYSALQLVESKQIIKKLYFSINQKPIPENIENELLNNKISINEYPLSLHNNEIIPNASQHNVPAWTIFAMFFVVISLGGSIVREKLSGSFIRLKALPTNYLLALISKQITYLGVTMAQAIVIFTMGVCLFPLIGLPALNLNVDIPALIIVSLVCGWCAVSYAICIGVLAQTQEQANGFGAVSIVILAAVGGLMVPSFFMPNSFRIPMKLSPLHWCLEAYYKLFLEGGKLIDVMGYVLPLLLIAVCFQVIAVISLKVKKLI